MTSPAPRFRACPTRCIGTGRRAALGALVVLAMAFGLLRAAPARAAEPATVAAPAVATAGPTESDRAELERRPAGYVHLFGTAEIGKGLRFNNPYRLGTQLGASAESLSLTASYLDLGAALMLGEANGLQHGAALHLTFSLAGISQQVFTPSYVLAYRPSSRLLGYGRVGPSIILSPDPTVGGEIAGGLGVFLTSRIALAGELVFDLYYGAGTPTRGITTYPILSGQLGLLVDYEVLP
ncbi:MAG: hypothetical protein ABI193_10475 [Minicystis sp.]